MKHYLSLLLALSCSGCILQPYKIDVEQGNLIETNKVTSIKPGMSKEDVIFILGQPALSDYFHPNRFDYIHDLKKGNGEHQREHVIIYFENDHVSRVVRD